MDIDFIKNIESPYNRAGLKIIIYKKKKNRIIDGILICKKNKRWYKIEDTILDLTKVDKHNYHDYLNFKKKYKINFTLKTDFNEIKFIEQQKEFFNKNTIRYEKEIIDSPFSKTIDRVLLKKFIKNYKSYSVKNILNIGGGSGREALVMAKNNLSVTIVDVSIEILKLAKKKLIKSNCYNNVNLICNYAEKLNIKDNTFDGFIIYGAAHHFNNPSTGFLEAIRVTKPNGMFFIWEPSISILRKVFDLSMKIFQIWKEEDNIKIIFNKNYFLKLYKKNTTKLKIINLILIPPHIYYVVPKFLHYCIMKFDLFLSNLPFLKNLGGTLVVSGYKKPINK
jgi:ubiquinone/menaquinone biosynthesis C-methylase UbiE/uncharacterized protein YbaR (Trm112 family)